MLKALRSLSLGDHTFAAGEVIPTEVQDSLPAGRVAVLKSQRLAEERSDEQLAQQVEELTDRVERLERKLNTQPKRARKAKVA